MSKLRPPVKTHGGKYYLAQWIVDNFPQGYEDLVYTEVFVGGGSVALNKKPSKKECVNDADWNIYCVWSVLQSTPAEFYDRLASLSYSAETFEASRERLSHGHQTVFETAVHEYVVRRMSRGGMRKAFAWSERLRGGKPGDLNAWETALASLPAVADRVKDFVVSLLDFRNVLDEANGPEHFLYLDPPYVKSTRAKGATEVYSCEMSDKDHEDMLALCNSSKSKIIISGYESDLYAKALSSWDKLYKNVANHSGQSVHKTTKREVLWKNF